MHKRGYDNKPSTARRRKDQGRKFAGGGGLEAQVLCWDYVQQNARPVERGIDEFSDGSVLLEREVLAFANRAVLAEWLKEKNG